MFTKTPSKRFLKTAALGFVVVLINVLLLRPFTAVNPVPNYGGIAYAQTGPADDTPTPIPTAQQPTIIIIPVSPGNGGTGGTGGSGGSGSNGSGGGGGQTTNSNDDDDNDNEAVPTPTFTPLPSTTPTLSPPEVIIIEVTPNITPTVAGPDSEPAPTEAPAAEASPTPVPSAEPELISDTPPNGVPPLAGTGAIYRIPANPNRTPAQLMFNLTHGKLTLTVPTFPELDVVVRLDEDPALALNLPLPMPESIRPLALFNLDVYLVSGSSVVAKVTTHSPELVLVTQQPGIGADEQVVLLRYNEPEQQYQFPRQNYEAATNTFTAYLDHTSFFILGAQSNQLGLIPLSSTPVPATVLPTEPSLAVTTEPVSAGGWLPWLWLFLAFLVIFAGLVLLFLLLGGGRAVASIVRSEPAAGAAGDYYTGGLLLAFPKQMLETGTPIHVNLSRLPTDVSPWPGRETRSPLAQVNLPSAGLGGFISAIKPNLMQLRQALSMPTGIKLIGWDETSFRLSKLSYAVVAGYLDWSGQDDSFGRLHDLQPGDDIEIKTRAGQIYHYRVDNVQSYQADSTAQIDIPPTAIGPQLLLTVWSELYDLDDQEFRDYVVVRAHMGQHDAFEEIEAIEPRPAAARSV
ncbi:MAG: class F sortase [Anaerolineaceae bacterium]|nr:class F sortase [Anaerolineaceae bacterium]MCB9101094.1 class F sortase [Anaerolineales bacterium]